MKIALNHLYKKYDKETIFDDLNYCLEVDHSITALLGPNGAGKTTLMKLLAGILSPYKGEIIVEDGHFDKQETYIQWAHKNVAYLSPDERYLSFKNTAFDNILYYGIIKGISSKKIKENVSNLMNHIDCESYIYKRVEQLSTGQKKIVKLLSIFSTGLPILLLDEPTVGLDVDTREKLIDIIVLLTDLTKQTIVISTHDLEFASILSNKQLFIFHGELKCEQSGKKTLCQLKEQYDVLK